MTNFLDLKTTNEYKYNAQQTGWIVGFDSLPLRVCRRSTNSFPSNRNNWKLEGSGIKPSVIAHDVCPRPQICFQVYLQDSRGRVWGSHAIQENPGFHIDPGKFLEYLARSVFCAADAKLQNYRSLFVRFFRFFFSLGVNSSFRLLELFSNYADPFKRNALVLLTIWNSNSLVLVGH